MGRALLFLTGGMFIVFGIIQSGVQNRLMMLPERTYNYHEELHAENAVNGVMEYAIREIIRDQSWDEGYQNNTYMDADVSLRVYDRNTPDRPANNIENWDEYTLLLYATAQYEGQLAQSEVYLRKDSFSKWSYFTDFEPNNIYFIWSDEVSGPVHTNGRFNMAGDPTFYGPISSPEMWHAYELMDTDPNFFGSTDFNSPRRDPPSTLELDQLRSQGTNGGLYFENNAEIEFLDDGQLLVREEPSRPWQQPSEYTVDLSLYNGVISSNSRISLKGTVNGSYTVHSTDDIIITGDIVYNEDPRDEPSSTDLLGIVSEKSVIIDRDAHQSSGNNDLNIHASIMALDKSFSAEDYNQGSSRGDLNLLGGIIQMERGPMGTFSGGQIRSGFNKDYEYDERLLQMVPPSFPRESVFSIIHWLTNVYPHTPSPDPDEEV
ncbi:MAG: hypothetical protein JJU46_03145 [Balneolaceae bacterium]|nr:hypothetical protein [Balneolaceae bacterium]MCH8547818.1 DUF4900 domain-containing protein [Balneolaceae bacterium]